MYFLKQKLWIQLFYTPPKNKVIPLIVDNMDVIISVDIFLKDWSKYNDYENVNILVQNNPKKGTKNSFIIFFNNLFVLYQEV